MSDQMSHWTYAKSCAYMSEQLSSKLKINNFFNKADKFFHNDYLFRFMTETLKLELLNGKSNSTKCLFYLVNYSLIGYKNFMDCCDKILYMAKELMNLGAQFPFDLMTTKGQMIPSDSKYEIFLADKITATSDSYKVRALFLVGLDLKNAFGIDWDKIDSFYPQEREKIYDDSVLSKNDRLRLLKTEIINVKKIEPRKIMLSPIEEKDFEEKFRQFMGELDSIISLNVGNAILRHKMASFDYDWTLVTPKEGRTFPKEISDWQWMYSDSPKVLRKLYEDGYMIVIFTNQSKQWKIEQIKFVMNNLDVPVFAMAAMDKTDHKPNRKMFDKLVGDFEIDMDESFFVGDALGRKSDFSDSDKKFAENIGLHCFSPEQLFSNKKIIPNIHTVEKGKTVEVVVMVGFPGSGKTSVAKKLCEDEKYCHIDGDIYKTAKKMLKIAEKCVEKKQSIVFDATNGTPSRRKEYIEFAMDHGYSTRCIILTTSEDESYRRNKERDDLKHVSKIVYNVYKKNYVEPTIEEGFDEVVEI